MAEKNLDGYEHDHFDCVLLKPAKILSPFSSTAPLQYVPKILFSQASKDCLTNNKTKNALHNKAVILNYVVDVPISPSLSN